MSISSVVSVESFDVPHDLDRISLSSQEDGSQLLQLQLGMAYDTHCLAVSDRAPGSWVLMALPSLLLGRDEIEVMQRDVRFALSKILIAVPADTASLTLVDPPSGRPLQVRAIGAYATKEPFTWEVVLSLESGHKLVFGKEGWGLHSDGARLRAAVRFEADFDVQVVDPRAVPFAMPVRAQESKP